MNACGAPYPAWNRRKAVVAERDGPCLQEDVLMTFRAADGAADQCGGIRLNDKKDLVAKTKKLSLFQCLYFLVVEAIREHMQHEFMGVRGSVGGLVDTEKSCPFNTKAPDGELSKQFILSANL